MVGKIFLALLVCLQSEVVLCAKVSVTSPLHTYYKEVKAILNNYKRPITVLEIGSSSSRYTLPIAINTKYHAICIALFEGDTTTLAHIAQYRKLKNVVILNPRGLPLNDVRTLGRCEHFDVVLVHGIDLILQEYFFTAINLLSQLGEFLFIQISSKNTKLNMLPPSFKRIASTRNHQLYLSHKPKTSLESGYFTAASTTLGKSSPYHIKSDFKEKWLFKQQSQSHWIPGINLITFVMLRGIYPSNTTIISQFERMKHSIPFHNDLVLKNVIVQGTTLTPIDFSDKEGNHKNMRACLDAAITIFKDKSRFVSPRDWINRYYTVVDKEIRSRCFP
jgi:hypothetical protein